MRTLSGVWMAAFVALAIATGSSAEQQVSPAERLKAIQKEYADARAAVYKQLQESADLPSTPQTRKKNIELWDAYEQGEARHFLAALELARAMPKSDVAFAALEWLFTTERFSHFSVTPVGREPFRNALLLVSEHHVTNPKISKLIAMLGPSVVRGADEHSSGSKALTEAVAEKNPNREARGQAYMALAYMSWVKFAVAEDQKPADVDALTAIAEQACTSAIRDYADCPWLLRDGKVTIGEEAKGILNELRNLRIGKVARDIESEDLDGAKFKLSDHRGKVTLLVFWASWCGPCIADVPHEKELIQHFQGRPFVLVGVNADEAKENALKAVKKHGIPWRSFWNGADGRVGPITTAWNAHSWPTIYVIDHQGVIRYKNLRGKLLDEPLEKLVAEAEKAKPN